MIVRRFLHADPIGISYFLGCVGKGTGAVVDPTDENDVYLQAASAAGVKIDYVIDTHIHADHISTGRALAKVADADYILSADADVGVRFKAARDGDELALGNVVIKVLATPGHTPEHICLLVTDRSRAREPWFVITGHTLMVGDLGRTELAVSAERGAKDLFASLRKLKALPDYLEVFPGAYSGSVCGRGLSGNPSSTIGFERRHNKAFGIETEDEFISYMLQDIPAPPPDAPKIRAVNSGRAAVPMRQ
ncbi:MAG: MBL fold metallo-hydrolase [Proteobacteria bacterium]|nr:MBL fold metallo-hydrolase [Pseudomonadota bacterium]